MCLGFFRFFRTIFLQFGPSGAVQSFRNGQYSISGSIFEMILQQAFSDCRFQNLFSLFKVILLQILLTKLPNINIYLHSKLYLGGQWGGFSKVILGL